MQTNTTGSPTAGTTHTTGGRTLVTDGTPGAWTVSEHGADGALELLGTSECQGARRAAIEVTRDSTPEPAPDVDSDDALTELDEHAGADTHEQRRGRRTVGRHTRARRLVAAQHRDAGRHIARALAGR